MKQIILVLLILSGYASLASAQGKDTLSTSNQTYLYKNYPEKLNLDSRQISVNPGAVVALLGGVSFAIGASQWKTAGQGSGDPDYDMISTGSKFMVAGIAGTSIGLIWFVVSTANKKHRQRTYFSLYKADKAFGVEIKLSFYWDIHQ